MLNVQIGEFVNVREVRHNIFPKWLVLTDLKFAENGRLIGGIVRHIENKKTVAGDRAAALVKKGKDTFIVRGATEGVTVGELFVE